MNLNPDMLAEAKDVIYNQCKLPESVKEPIHIAVKMLMTLEFAYKDFLSREICGEVSRANPVLDLIEIHGGDATPLYNWFLKYEKPELLAGDSAKTVIASAWGG